MFQLIHTSLEGPYGEMNDFVQKCVNQEDMSNALLKAMPSSASLIGLSPQVVDLVAKCLRGRIKDGGSVFEKERLNY